MVFKKIHFPIFCFFLIAIQFSCKNNENSQSAEKYRSLNEKGYFFFSKLQLDSAFYYYNEAKNIAVTLDEEKLAYSNLQIATIKQYNGDLYGCEETITEALANYGGDTYKPYFYNLLAVSYDKQKNFSDALKYYKKAELFFSSDIEKAVARNNIGLIYLEKHEYEKSNQILKSLVKDPLVLNTKSEYARVLDNLGYSQYKSNNPEGITNLYKSFQIRDSLQDRIGLIASNMHLSEYYRNSNQDQAQKYAFGAFNSAKKVNSPDDKLEALRWLVENSDPILAKQYSIEFLKLNDSITMARSMAKNQFAKIKFDSTKALQESENQKNQKRIYFILFVFTVAIAILLFFLIRFSNSNKLKTISYNTETRIAKKLHDELANDVYNTMTFAETQDLQNPDKKETLLENLDKIYSRTRNISKENSSINTDERFEEHLKEMLSSFIGKERNVIIKNDVSIQWLKVAPEKKIAIYRVLQELLVNMKKHSQSTLVVIGFETKGNDIEINYNDNGIGCSEILNLKNGLLNAENRIHIIKGKITFESETGKGFKSKIIFPQ